MWNWCMTVTGRRRHSRHDRVARTAHGAVGERVTVPRLAVSRSSRRQSSQVARSRDADDRRGEGFAGLDGKRRAAGGLDGSTSVHRSVRDGGRIEEQLAKVREVRPGASTSMATPAVALKTRPPSRHCRASR